MKRERGKRSNRKDETKAWKWEEEMGREGYEWRAAVMKGGRRKTRGKKIKIRNGEEKGMGRIDGKGEGMGKYTQEKGGKSKQGRGVKRVKDGKWGWRGGRRGTVVGKEWVERGIYVGETGRGNRDGEGG